MHTCAGDSKRANEFPTAADSAPCSLTAFRKELPAGLTKQEKQARLANFVMQRFGKEQLAKHRRVMYGSVCAPACHRHRQLSRSARPHMSSALRHPHALR